MKVAETKTLKSKQETSKANKGSDEDGEIDAIKTKKVTQLRSMPMTFLHGCLTKIELTT